MNNISPAQLLYMQLYQPNMATGQFLHRHMDFYQLYWVQEGEAEATCGDDSITITKNDILIIPPGLFHGLNKNESPNAQTPLFWDLKIRINDKHLADVINRLPRRISKEDGLQILFDFLQQAAAKNDIRDSYITAFLFRITEILPLHEKAKKVSHERASFIAKKYIEQHCCEYISLESICRELGYNKSYLCAVFKKDFHHTVNEYIMARRIEKVKEMLLYSDEGMITIAAQCGFKSVHHMFKAFKEYTGQTPKHFRLMQS